MRVQLRRSWLSLLAVVALGSTMSNAQVLALPTSGFISGLPGTEKDVPDGNALFVAKIGNAYIGKPLPITIPQYALWSHGGGRSLVVIVQAEEANGTRLFGFRDSAGKDTIATGPEIELLGTTPPKIPN